jgi:hypothetical protein
MALQKTIVEEGILSKQERSVLRGILRISYLTEAVNSLEKSVDVLTSGRAPGASGQVSKTQALSIRNYLLDQVNQVLMATKVPGSSSAKEEADPTSSPTGWPN